jgi:hypothetical protein
MSDKPQVVLKEEIVVEKQEAQVDAELVDVK